MGRALHGWTVEILDGDFPAPDRAAGRVAVDLASSPPTAFTGYRDAPEVDTFQHLDPTVPRPERLTVLTRIAALEGFPAST